MNAYYTETMNKIDINIIDFIEQFNKEYDYLYEHHDCVAGYDEAVQEFDDFLESHNEFVAEFSRFRGDYITSDREAAAFMFAFNEMTDNN